ncbi:phosphatase inhibitor-domain-containing protein [Mycena rosella]|uniref:Type 1 phosphatases regulator n=1 Tax=Mycena rosella TaxID=1033263 RepID=A0AAD7D837_MYCRO|nr:phosphatase inhibitor-domain-containing protein [Mycena rosella]
MAYLATQRRPNTSAPGDGSRTITITDASPLEDDGSGNPGEPAPIGALHLRGGSRRTRQRVVWDEDVVDNEGCGRKSSKICCIYHKPKNFDESSDSDSSDSDSDSSYDDARSRARRHQQHHHSHPHPHPPPSPGAGGAGAAQRDPQAAAVTQLEEASGPNAYEIVPSGKKGKGKRKSG